MSAKRTFESIVAQSKENVNPEAEVGEDKKASPTSALIDQLQAKFGEFEKIKEKEQTEFVGSDELTLEVSGPWVNKFRGERGCQVTIVSLQAEPADKEFALRQAKMQVQLSEYDSELMKKEMLHRKMLENILSTAKDTNTEELKSRIELLEREKEELQELVRSGDSQTAPDSVLPN